MAPEPVGVEYSEDGLTVYVPTDVWIQIAEYYLDVDEARQKYEAIRSEYELSGQ